MRLSTQILIVVALAGLLAGGWWLLDDNGNATAGKSQRKSTQTLVLTETVKFAEDNVLRAIGTGEALKSASIYPSVAGELSKWLLSPDSASKKAMCCSSDAKHQRLAVKLADVALKEAARQLKRLERLAPSGAASVALATARQSASARRLDQARASLSDRTIYAPFNGVIGLTDIERGDRVSDQI